MYNFLLLISFHNYHVFCVLVSSKPKHKQLENGNERRIDWIEEPVKTLENSS